MNHLPIQNLVGTPSFKSRHGYSIYLLTFRWPREPNPGRSKVSKEKTIKGKRLYPPRKINKLFERRFHSKDWKELKDFFDIEIPDYPYMVKRAFKQCDYFKQGILMEVQFGKYAFMFYDLAKFQHFFNQGKIKVGVEIVPCHFLHKQMSTGVSYGEQLVYDLERLSKNFPSVPVMIVLIDMALDTNDYFLEESKEVRKVHKEIQKLLQRGLI